MAEFENGLLSTLSVHSVVQDMASDATILLSIFYSITPSELDGFIDKFASLLLRGSQINALATSEIISELLTLELDRSLWKLRDSRKFMKGEGSIARLIDKIANLSVTAPDSNYVAQLCAVCTPLSTLPCNRSVIFSNRNGEEGDTEDDGFFDDLSRGRTPTGLSFDAEMINPDMLTKFSTSELAGLAAAEQQFLLEVGSPPPNEALDESPPLGPGGHDVGKLMTRSTHSPNRSHLQNLSFLMARSQVLDEKDEIMRDVVDYFCKLETNPSEPCKLSNADLQSGVDSIVGLCTRVIEVSFSLIDDWPEALRRAMWTVMRAISGSGLAHTSVIQDEETLYTIEYTAIATLVVHRIIGPAIRSIPSLVLHQNDCGVTTTSRYEWIASLLEKTAWAENVSSHPTMNQLAKRCGELTDRWVSFFLALTKFHQVPQSLWPMPIQGNSSSYTVLSADQELALSFFEICDRSFITYVHTSMLLRPLSEALHITVWMRFTRYLQRLKLGRVVKCFNVSALSGEVGKPRVAKPMSSADDEDLLNGTVRHTYAPPGPGEALSRGSFNISSLEELDESDMIHFNPDAEASFLEQYEMMEEIISYARSTFHSVKSNILLSNFCSIAGCDEDGAAVIVLYGDLLSCYLSNFEKGRDNLRRFKEYCPKFFKYRTLYLEYLKHVNPDGKYNEWNDGDAIAHIFFLVDMAIQHNSRNNSFYFIFLTENVTASRSIDRTWVREVLRFLPQKHREFCRELIFVKTREDDTLDAGDDLLTYFSKVTLVENICDLPLALPKITTYLPISPFDYNGAVLAEERRTGMSGSRVYAKERASNAGDLDSMEEWEKLRGRWSRSLGASDVLRKNGIWPLGTVLSFFEIMVTSSCRREWSDARLRPMLGLPVIGLHGIFDFVVSSFKEFTPRSLDYVDKETEWMNVNPQIYLNPDCRSAAATIVDNDASGASRRIAASAPISWVHRTWLYVGGTEEDIAEREAYDSALQRLFYLWNNLDINVKGDSFNDGPVSLCWGIDMYRFRPDGDHSVTRKLSTDNGSVASRLIPSCRHMTLHSVWRLLIYNVNRTCRLIQEHTPSACPFLKMITAVQDRLDRLTNVPDTEQVTSTQREMINVASKALRTCASGEADVVCLVVGIVAYVRNMDNMRRRVSSTGLAPLTLQVYITSTSQLVLGRPVSSEAESRVMEILCSNGKELMERSGLRYYESCTWHPYSKLLYNI